MAPECNFFFRSQRVSQLTTARNMNPYEPLELISQRLKAAVQETLKVHSQLRDTEIRLHGVGREMAELHSNARTGNELDKADRKKSE